MEKNRINENQLGYKARLLIEKIRGFRKDIIILDSNHDNEELGASKVVFYVNDEGDIYNLTFYSFSEELELEKILYLIPSETIESLTISHSFFILFEPFATL